jgi:hypothetical protein
MCGVSGDDHSRADRGLADRGLADRGLADRGLAGAEAPSDGMNIASRRTRNPEISTASLGSEMPMTMITVPARPGTRTTPHGPSSRSQPHRSLSYA